MAHPDTDKTAAQIQHDQYRQERLKQRLELIDSMPDDAAIDICLLSILKGRSFASIWRDVKAGRISPPFKAGPRSTRWRLGDVRGVK